MITAVLVRVIASGHGRVTAGVFVVVKIRYAVVMSNMIEIRLGAAVENKEQA